MGCDGGTIPKRNEIVKNKRKDQTRDKEAELSAKWQYCSLSGLKLKEPIVACQLGRLYNLVAIVEHLLERQAPASRKQASSSSKPDDPIAHVRCLKDTKKLELKKRDDSDSSRQASSTTEQLKTPFICPISGLEISGKYKFYFLFTCGCVFSERALKEVPTEKQCIVCHQPYDPDMDLIVLNGDIEETKELERRILARRKRTLDAKKARKEKQIHDDRALSKRHKSGH